MYGVGMGSLLEALGSRNSSSVQASPTRVIDILHASGVPSALQNGLQQIFARLAFPLSSYKSISMLTGLFNAEFLIAELSPVESDFGP
jgi:hypothetical protein